MPTEIMEPGPQACRVEFGRVRSNSGLTQIGRWGQLFCRGRNADFKKHRHGEGNTRQHQEHAGLGPKSILQMAFRLHSGYYPLLISNPDTCLRASSLHPQYPYPAAEYFGSSIPLSTAADCSTVPSAFRGCLAASVSSSSFAEEQSNPKQVTPGRRTNSTHPIITAKTTHTGHIKPATRQTKVDTVISPASLLILGCLCRISERNPKQRPIAAMA